MLSFCSLADENEEELLGDRPWAGLRRAVSAGWCGAPPRSGSRVSARTTSSAEVPPLPEGGPGGSGALFLGGRVCVCVCL